MTLPTIDKTYQFDVNGAFATDTTTASYLGHSQAKLRAVKNKLIGLAHSPWTPYYSCNGLTAGTPGDGVDRWVSDADLVWATSEALAHSWMVLRQPGLYGIQLLLSLVSSANGDGLTAVTSVAGFTGGSTTARPTAVDEVVHALGTDITAGNATYKGWSSLLATSWVDTVHVLQSTDGVVTRVLFTAYDTSPAGWLIEGPKNPVSGWSHPYFGCVKSSGSTSSVFGTVNSAAADANVYLRGRGAGVMSFLLATQGIRNGLLDATVAGWNDFNGQVHTNPWSLYSATVANVGRHGTVYDCWEGLRHTNDSLPASGTMRQFMQIGSLLVPWNGASMETV
jgi:hypothetical protein